jgi:hypothetical protein
MPFKKIVQQSAAFYPDYLKAHSDKHNRLLHFIGATSFFILIGLFFVTYQIWLLPAAVFLGYLLPGIGHRFLQHNDSFRATKPVICVICATKLYWDTLTFQIAKKLRSLGVQ